MTGDSGCMRVSVRMRDALCCYGIMDGRYNYFTNSIQYFYCIEL